MKPQVLSVQDLTMHFSTRKGWVSAVDNVSFDIYEGEVLGLVGESGCGKTSVALTLIKLLPENAKIFGGAVYMSGVDLIPLSEDEVRPFRWQRISMVFQAAMNSLNPVYRVGDQIMEAMETHFGDAITREAARARIAELFEAVELDPQLMDRYPHEFSGGMRQRAIIAMALSCNPQLVIADEPTTALDVIVQDRLLKQLKVIQEQLGLAMLYISHDIAVIAEISDRMGVMYAGRMAELTTTMEIFEHPVHPYTYALLNASPNVRGARKKLSSLPGEPPNLLYPPSGCRFHPRCTRADDLCKQEVPPFKEHREGHYAACWHPME
jgi:peptide/nickel transport system ATP-binding protein